MVLLIQGPHGGKSWRRLHTPSFFFWFWVMSAHVLTYIWRAPGLALADLIPLRGRRLLGGAVSREPLVIGSVLLGVAVAVAFISLDASWVHWESLRRFDG
jgi:K+ transporter